MNVPCPKCKEAFEVPEEVMTRGVAHVACSHCAFKFVIRLGDPGSSKKKEEPPPGAPLKLEGVKTSGAADSASGEIGGAGQPKFMAAQTTTSIHMDPQFEEEIRRAQGGLSEVPTQVDDQPALAAATTEVDQPAPTEAQPPAETPAAAQPPAETPAPAQPPATTPAPAETPASAEPQPPATTPAAAQPAAAALPTAPPPGPAAQTAGALNATAPGAPAVAPTQPDGAFESFKAVNAVPAPPPGAEVPPLQPPPAGFPVVATHQVIHPAYQHPLVMVITPQNPEDWTIEDPEATSRGMRAFGLFVSLLLLVATGFLLFVLSQNDWSLDLADIGGMVDRAFGTEQERTNVPDELRGLEVAQPDNPIVEQAKLADGQRVLTVQGVVRNNDTRTRRFVYVRATLIDQHDRKVTSVETPAGNVFTAEQLAKLTRQRLFAAINPAGRDGSNARLEPGQSEAYMVVITAVPHDYSPSTHKVHVEVSQAELFLGP